MLRLSHTIVHVVTAFLVLLAHAHALEADKRNTVAKGMPTVLCKRHLPIKQARQDRHRDPAQVLYSHFISSFAEIAFSLNVRVL
jgi:hypothetical protein